MRISLIGPSYTARSVAAAAQRSINVYQETVQVPVQGQALYAGGAASGGEKNKVNLYGAPGLHLFKTLTAIDAAATPVRGVWSGGGRLFVAAGTKYFELDSTGALVGSVRTIADDAFHTPVQFFANGNQLFLVSAGFGYLDNGAGPTLITFAALVGTVNTNGGSVTWVTGDKFDAGMKGQNITINAVVYVVLDVWSTTSLSLTTSAGVQAGVAYTSTPALTATTGAFLDGYFIAQRPNSRQFNISNLLNGLTWASLDYGIKSGYPDYIKAIYADHEQLYLFGTETGEVYQNTGNADFPFERIPGAFHHDGLVATWSPVSLGGKLYWIGGGARGQAVAYRLDGFTPVPVSTRAVEEQWKSFSASVDPREGVSYAYQDGGHQFWVINFTSVSGKLTWVYDATEDTWDERASATNNVFTGLPDYTAYKGWYHTFIPEWGNQGKHLVGDYASGKLYEMSTQFADDDGSILTCERDMNHIYSEGKRIFHGKLTLEMESGTVPSGAAPVVTLYWSDDRGHTFGKPDGSNIPTLYRTMSMGTLGQYSQRLYTNQLGQSRDRVYKIIIQSKAKVALIDAFVDVEVGAH